MNYLERVTKPRAYGLLALASLLLVFAACQLAAGVQSRTLDPIASGCSLPTGSGPQLRFANLAPNPDALDLCVRTTGSSWGEPLILNGGSNCGSYFPAKGFTYSQISIPFAAPGGTVDVKTVLGGGNCNAAPIGELNGVKLLSAPACTAPSCVTTLVALGGASNQPKKLVALPESSSMTSNGGEAFRFVNALPGVSAIDVGPIAPPPAGASAQLPASLVPPAWNLTNGIPYGGTMTKGQQTVFGEPVEAGGYLSVIGGAAYNLVITEHGKTDGLLLFPDLVAGSATASLYAVGIAYNDTYPLEGLYCTEGVTATGSNPLLMSCTPSELPTLSFDVFNPALYGPNSPYFSLRDPQYAAGPGSNPISTRNSDVMCLVEVDTLSDQMAIVNAVKGGNFNYSYTITANLQTPFSNSGQEQEGGTCPTTGQPACATVPAATMTSAFNCMEQYCSSNGASGTLNQSTDCLSTNCLSQLADLVVAYPNCLDCVLDNVTSDQPYGASLTTCTTSPYPSMGYQGSENSLILSKYPIVNSDSYVLPSSYYRRSVLYTQVQFPGNVTIDFYCGFLQTLSIATDLPYQGCFGNGGKTSEDAYTNENLYEAQLMASWIQAKSNKSGNPAVILGDWHAGLGSTSAGASDGGLPPPTAIGPGTISFLASVLTPVSGPDWPAAGQCNNCPGTVNLLNTGNTTSYFTLQPFLYHWPSSNGGSPVHSEQLTFTENAIAIPPSTTNNAPISPYYGLNIQILRPQGKQQAGDAGATH